MTTSKIDNFRRALARLDEAIAERPAMTEHMSLWRDACIQRFEFTLELAWKTVYEILKDGGIDILGTPRTVIKSAIEGHILTNEEAIFMDQLVNTRNILSHEYGEEKSVESLEYVLSSVTFFGMILERLEKIKQTPRNF